MAEKYTIPEEQKKRFAGLYLLEYMINTPKSIGVFLDGNDQDLEPVLEWLMMHRFIEIRDEEKYVPTVRGREELKKFMARYSEFLTMFDIYCAVDLEAGEFAFADYFSFDSETEWKAWLNEERWDDLRVAVADFKNINPVEIVFMSFINERRFGRDASGWQFDLLLGSVWDDILGICKTAIQWEQLGFEDEEGMVPAEDVITDIITQGTEIMLGLLDEEADMAGDTRFGDENGSPDAEYFVDEVEFPRFQGSHYRSYRDAHYVSPNWRN